MAKQERWNSSPIVTLPMLAALLAAVALFANGSANAGTSLLYHPAIAAWAEEHPDELVPLIVQHDGTPDDLLTFVEQAGGDVEREFHMLPAIDIDLPADQVDDLASQGDVSWVSLDAPIQSTGAPPGLVDKSNLADPYPVAVKAEDPWAKGVYGSGVTVALIDTGVSSDTKEDFRDASGNLRVQRVSIRPNIDPDRDGFGHGSHVAGIIAGYSSGTSTQGKYTGIAPGADILSVRIADDNGNATVGDLMAGLEYVDDNREEFNIRVLNLSVTSSIAQSYKVDPIDAAVELLWFKGVVVVVAAGNDGTASDAVNYPPANDPFVITVGAFDDAGTTSYSDDRHTSWSSRGTTQDGYAKPELMAPGVDLPSPISPASYLATNYPQGIVEQGNQMYFAMSGTSMAAGVISGVAALVVEAHPDWTPGEIKATLIDKGRNLSSNGGRAPRAGDTNNQSKPKPTSDDGITPSYVLLAAIVGNEMNANSGNLGGLLGGVTDPVLAAVGSVLNEDDEATLNGIRWRDTKFLGIRWRGLEFNGIRWRQVDWTGIRWRNVEFNGIRWRGSADFESVQWQGIRWRAFVED
ncbi:MAG: S8 family serine peptidase [Dehalococcoidia bacterium]